MTASLPGSPEDGERALDSQWTVWLDRSDKGMTEEEYLEGLRQQYDFRTLQELRSQWRSQRMTERLGLNVNVRIFRSGVRPVWEAEENRRGGKWLLSFIHASVEETLAHWARLVDGLAQGRFVSRGAPEDLVGAVLSMRPWGCMMSLWSARSPQELVYHVSRKLRKVFATSRVKYQTHVATIERNEARSLSSSSGTVPQLGGAGGSKQSARVRRSKSLRKKEAPPLLDMRVVAACVAVVAVLALFMILLKK